MTVSEYIVDFLKQQGIDSAYAVIGSTAMWLFNALGKEKAIRTICTNHEQAAAMAADGWSCIKEKPGVVFLTNGPGITNALSGVAQAWTDSVPLFIVSGEVKTGALAHEIQTGMRQYGSQSIRTNLVVSPFVKYYHLLDKPEDTRKTVEAAYYTAKDGRPGPVWISVPIDVQNAQVPENMVGWEVPLKDEHKFHKEVALQIKTALLSAKRPLIIAGQGVRLSHCVNELREFIEKYEIPIVTSRMGNDLIESNHPLFVGRPGNWGNRPAHFALQTADRLLILGSRLALNTTGNVPAEFAPQAEKYIVDIDTVEFEKPGIEFKMCLEADVGEFLKSMEELTAPDLSREDRRKWCKRCSTWRQKYPVMMPEYQTRTPMSTYYFIDRLSALSAERDIILSDTGSCCNIVSQVWNLKRGQRLRVSGGLSCMGYWVTAIGAARANEQGSGNVICIVGDGSLQMNIQELGTIVHYGLPIKIMVINNNGYQIIRISQQSYMKGDFFAISPETGVGLANTERIAQAYGIKYRRVEQPHDVDDAVRWALDYNGPAILEVVVAEDQVMLPRLTSQVQPDGKLKSASF